MQQQEFPRVRVVATSEEQTAFDAERDLVASNRFGMALAVYRKNPHPYERGVGIVTIAERAKRRARGKVAKASRKANRG